MKSLANFLAELRVVAKTFESGTPANKAIRFVIASSVERHTQKCKEFEQICGITILELECVTDSLEMIGSNNMNAVCTAACQEDNRSHCPPRFFRFHGSMDIVDFVDSHPPNSMPWMP